MRLFRDARGFTLLEVMIAMFLLAVALLGLVAAFPSAYYAVYAGRQLTTASALSLEVLEGAKRRSFLGITQAALIAEYPAAPPGYPGYTRQIQVDDIVQGGSLVMKRLTVTTRYNVQGTQVSLPLVTLIAR